MNVQGSTEEQLAQALKKLEDAELRCQATTREIWQIDMALGREEDRANAAEARSRELEQRIQELEAGAGGAAPPAALEAELRNWQARAEAAEARVTSSESLLRAAQARSDQLETLASEAQERLEVQSARAQGLESKNRDLVDDLQAAEARLRQAERWAEEVEANLREVQAGAGASRDLQDDLLAAQARLRSAEERSEAATRTLEEREDRLRQAESRVQELESRLRETEERLEAAERRVETATIRAESAEISAGASAQLADRLAEAEGRAREAERSLEIAEQRAEASAQRAHVAEVNAGAEHEERLKEALRRAEAAESSAGAGAELVERLAEAEQRLQEAEARLRSAEEREQDAESRFRAAQAQRLEAEQKLAELAPRELGNPEAEARLLEAEQRAQQAEESLKEAQYRARSAEENLQEAQYRARSAEERLTDAQSQVAELRVRLEQAPAGAPDPALQGQVDAAKLRAYEAEERARSAEDRARQAQEQVQSLEARLAAQGPADQAPTGGGSPELEAQLQKAQEMAQLNAEKAELLTARSQQAMERAQLAEEKVTLAEARAQQSEERALAAEQRVREAEGRARQAQAGAGDFEDRIRRAEDRARDSDKVYAAAEEKAREAEQLQKESWARVRDAELKANQASVELKKLNEKIAEYEKRTQESDRETQRLAFQDALTGLPNYNLINQYLDFTVKQCVRYKRVSALLVIDIDRFKVFNEAMGFKAGDELLVSIAERLKTAVRDTDSLGRRGEDEFLILLSELNPGDENASADTRRLTLQANVELVAKRVMNSLATPFVVQGQKYYIQASIGISLCPDDAETPSTMFENADTAMYHVKETGRNRYHFYSADMRKRQEKRLTLDTQLRHALERNEFALLYQPIVNLAAGKGKGSMVGVEAFIRWNHRIDGLVTPDYFLPAAEESGMIVPIGHWVVQQVCAMMRDWLGSGLRIFASINLSKRQLLQADLVDTVLAIVSEHRIPPEVIYMDIAEGVNTLNPDLMDRVIAELGQAGIRIAIDDFGIGYSSLARINPTYTKILKIDSSIIRGLPNDKQSTTVCIAAINLARSLGLLPLAEGVENANQVKFLTKYECALAQGFFFSEPVPPAEIGAMHRNKKVWKF